MPTLRELITLHQKVEIKRKEEESLVYQAAVQDIQPTYFAVGIPMVRRIPLRLKKGEEILVTAYAPDARYTFETKVLGRKKDVIPLYLLAWPLDFRREQRRQHIRVKVVLEVFFQVLRPGEEAQLPLLQVLTSESRKKALSVDLSGGGMQLLVREEIPAGSFLLLDFSLLLKGKEREFHLLGKVHRCTATEVRGARSFLAGVSFENITEQEREAIISFVFRKMVTRRRQVED